MSKQPTKGDYELTFILGERANQEEGTKKAKEYSDLIAKLKGSVTKQELWGRRELAYPIKQNRSGFYITLWFSTTGPTLQELERALLFDEEIIRFLTTKAYTTDDIEAGSLHPEDENKKDEESDKDKPETMSAEEEIRRSSAKPAKKKKEEPADESGLDEDKRKEKVDEALEELLKEDE